MHLRSRFSGLWVRVALPFLVFVLLGSLALLIWMQARAESDSRHNFVELVEKNARFIAKVSLPANEKMAEYLSEILNLKVFFSTQGSLMPTSSNPERTLLERAGASPGLVVLEGGSEAVAHPMRAGDLLLLLRPRGEGSLLEGWTYALVVAFWFLTFGLAWWLIRGVVQPLRSLTARLPGIEKAEELPLPGLDREDELGLLARTIQRTHSELRLERSRREAAEKLALLGKFTTGLAHEIHNPLSAIRMHAQLIQTATPRELQATASESIPLILGETTKIEALVNQWMFLARPAPPQTSMIELGELLQRVVATNAPLAAHAGVEVRQTVLENFRIRGDRRRLSQALSNVVLNAIQAMPRGGILKISVSIRKDFAQLEFRDTGPGFGVEALSRFAELFYSEKEGGMGIGLSVTVEILKAHGGRVRVHNPDEGGACVILELPYQSV